MSRVNLNWDSHTLSTALGSAELLGASSSAGAPLGRRAQHLKRQCPWSRFRLSCVTCSSSFLTDWPMSSLLPSLSDPALRSVCVWWFSEEALITSVSSQRILLSNLPFRESRLPYVCPACSSQYWRPQCLHRSFSSGTCWLTSYCTKSILCLTEHKLSQQSLLRLSYEFVPAWVLMAWPTARSLIKEKKRWKVYFLVTTLNNSINGPSTIALYNLILALIMSLF